MGLCSSRAPLNPECCFILMHQDFGGVVLLGLLLASGAMACQWVDMSIMVKELVSIARAAAV